MKHLFKLFSFLVISFALGANPNDVTPVGTWKTVSTYTGKVRSHVKLWLDKNGTLHGNLIKIIEDKETYDEFCGRCKDDRKGNRVEGIEFLRHMTRKDKNDFRFWHEGRALDPRNGKEYDCLLKMEKGNNSLEFRCYIGTPVFGRSEFWKRIE